MRLEDLQTLLENSGFTDTLPIETKSGTIYIWQDRPINQGGMRVEAVATDLNDSDAIVSVWSGKVNDLCCPVATAYAHVMEHQREKREKMGLPRIKKFLLSDLHRTGHNKHSYWDGNNWTEDESKAVRYASIEDAEKSKKSARMPHVIAVVE